MRFAVFASGNGSNFQAIVDACRAKKIDGEVVLCVCDRLNAYAIERAKNHGIPVFSFNAKDYSSKEAYENEILSRCRDYKVDFICLAGYMRLIGNTLLNAYENRMINLHPSLLPKYKGKDALGQALAAGDYKLGASIHYVNNELDGGQVIAQATFQREEKDTREMIETKLHHIEHELYVKALNQCIKERQ